MVLKRLILTALGALGLGALASGPAFSQNNGNGQIPAPNFYGDITSCSGGTLPEASTAMGAMSLLGMGGLLDMAFDSSTDTGIQMDYTQDAALIVTAAADNESNGLVALLDPSGEAKCNNDVAGGYTMAVELYNEYVSAKSAADATGATAEDRAAFTAAQGDKDAYGGAVYDRVYSQQMRLAAANKAIEDYNKLAGSMGTLSSLKNNQGGTGGYDAIVVNNGDGTAGNFVLVADTANPTADETRALQRVYGSMGVQGYQSILTAADDSERTAGGAITDVGVFFNTAGVLQLGMSASTTVTTLGNINSELAAWETELTAANTALDEARKAGNLNTAPQQERVRKAKLGRDHVQSELDRLTSIVRRQNRDIAEASQVTIGTGNAAKTYAKERELVDAYAASQRRVTTAATGVRSAVKALDDANKALMTELASADSYLSQLVTLRQYEQSVAEKEQRENGGANAAQSFKDAVTEAQKAVTAAEMLQTTHTSLTGDTGSPGSKLLSALLQPEMVGGEDNAKDDDGLALVNAVTETHQAALNAEKTAMDAKTRADEVAEMIGDGSAVEGNTMKIGENAGDIMELDGRVTANEGDIDQINMDLYGTTSSQHADASACAEGAAGLVNIANCADARSRHNAGDIADLDGEVEALGVRVGDNEDAIAMNAEGIAANTMAIESNDMDIAMNAEGIMTNAGNIMTNADNIAAETANRMEADMMLAGGIDANKMRLDTHEMLVGQNTSAISALDGRVGSNESAIMRNSGMIGELSESLEVVRAGVAASMALAGMPAVNGRGIAIGVGSFDGESAFAVGFQIQGEQASFKVGVTSSGGATGASAGVGFNF